MPKPKKSLGQNFLISPRVVSTIVNAGDIKPGEIVLEVGPGRGTLTKALLAAGSRVEAIEKDVRLIPVLAQTFKSEIGAGKLKLVHGDILKMNPGSLNLETPYKLIANIPYYITGVLIRNFLSAKIKPSLCVLMVQKEVADRIIAKDSKESILSLSVKAYAEPNLVMNVSRGNFFPVPNVDSAVIKFSNIRNPFKNEEMEEVFFALVKAGFAQKRKKLISNLEKVMIEKRTPKEKGSGLKQIFEKLKLGENTRAEDVPLEIWFEISKLCSMQSVQSIA